MFLIPQRIPESTHYIEKSIFLHRSKVEIGWSCKWLRHWSSAALCLPRVSLFSPFARFVCISTRSGSSRLGNARTQNGPPFLSLFLFFSSCLPFARPLAPLQPLATITRPHSYQPLVFTSDQAGGDLDKTTSKLRYPRLPLSLCPARRHVSSIVGEEEKDGGLSTNTRIECRGLHIEKHGTQKRGSTEDRDSNEYSRICQNNTLIFRRVTFWR